MKLMTSIKFLARQVLPLRVDDSGEVDGNFNQLLKLRSEDESDGKPAELIKKRVVNIPILEFKMSYTAPDESEIREL